MNKPPLAKLGGPMKAVRAGVEIVFDGSESIDPDGTIGSWDLDFDDGTPHADGDGPPPSSIPHTYAVEGDYYATLMVWESGRGRRKGHSASILVQVREPRDAVLTDFALSTYGPWGPCVEGPSGFEHTRQETWTRTIVDPAEAGGWTPTADDLTEPRVGVERCTPEPVNCVLSEWTIVREGLFGPCIDGRQTKTIDYAKTILVHPENGGTACEGPFTRTETVEQSCIVVVGGENSHANFEARAALPECVASFSLRDQAQLNRYSQKRDFALYPPLSYDPAHDPDPDRQDAAKMVIVSDSSSNQLRLPLSLSVPIVGGSLAIFFDSFWGRSYADKVKMGPLNIHKQWQLTSPWDNSTRFIEVRMCYYMAGEGDVGEIDIRSYWPGRPAASLGTNARQLPIANRFMAKPLKWHRYMLLWESVQDGNDRFSLYLCDEDRGPIAVYDRIEQDAKNDTLYGLWLEWNSSATRDPALGPLTSYLCDVTMLRNHPDPLSLLQRPTPHRLVSA